MRYFNVGVFSEFAGFKKIAGYTSIDVANIAKEKLEIIHKKVIEYDDAFDQAQIDAYDAMVLEVKSDVKELFGDSVDFDLTFYPFNRFKIMVIPLNIQDFI